MRITQRTTGALLEFEVEGRLDAYWADHFVSSVRAAVREGNHRIVVDMAGVTYLSSAGIGALVKCLKELQAVHGSFSLANSSEAVAKILAASGLTQLLVSSAAVPIEAAEADQQSKSVELLNINLELYEYTPAAAAVCRLTGNAGVLTNGSFSEADCRRVSFGAASYGLGIGAPGTSFADCRSRFGEFIAVGGAVGFLPTDEGSVPDYLVSAEQFVPELYVVHSLTWEGEFTQLMRFECKAGNTLSLEELAGQALDLIGNHVVGMVMVAEVDRLVGAALKRSPASATPGTRPLEFPQVRDWLTFAAERAYSRCLAMVAGVVAREPDAALRSSLRPLGPKSTAQGHFHAAAFSYRPLPKGRIGLPDTVRPLFETEGPRGILHLLNDSRPAVGSGQSEFVRGACWVVPIASVIAEGR